MDRLAILICAFWCVSSCFYATSNLWFDWNTIPFVLFFTNVGTFIAFACLKQTVHTEDKMDNIPLNTMLKIAIVYLVYQTSGNYFTKWLGSLSSVQIWRSLEPSIAIVITRADTVSTFEYSIMTAIFFIVLVGWFALYTPTIVIAIQTVIVSSTAVCLIYRNKWVGELIALGGKDAFVHKMFCVFRCVLFLQLPITLMLCFNVPISFDQLRETKGIFFLFNQTFYITLSFSLCQFMDAVEYNHVSNFRRLVLNNLYSIFYDGISLFSANSLILNCTGVLNLGLIVLRRNNAIVSITHCNKKYITIIAGVILVVTTAIIFDASLILFQNPLNPVQKTQPLSIRSAKEINLSTKLPIITRYHSSKTNVHKIALWSAAGNGNVGDGLQPLSLLSHIKNLGVLVNTTFTIESWSVEPCCYSFPETLKVQVPANLSDPVQFERFASMVQHMDEVWIGGGGLLSYPHPPFSSEDKRWQFDIIKLYPKIKWKWIAVGADNPEMQYLYFRAAPLLRHASVVSVRDDFSMHMVQNALPRVSVIILKDPVLCDNENFPKPEPKNETSPFQRICWILKLPLSDSLINWINHFIQPDHIVFALEQKDGNFYGAFPKNPVRLYNSAGSWLWKNIVEECSAVVSMRFHGLILALRALKPMIAIQSDSLGSRNKLQHLMDDFDLSDCNVFDEVERTDPLKFDVNVWKSCIEQNIGNKHYQQKIYNKLNQTEVQFTKQLVETIYKS